MQAVIGIDPHKHVLTAIALDVRGGRLGQWTGGTTRHAIRALQAWATQVAPQAAWAIEGSNFLGRRLALALVDAGADVRDVCPARTSERRRRRPSRGKSDAVDAEAIARELIAHPDLPHAFKTSAPGRPEPAREALAVVLRTRHQVVDHHRRLLNEVDVLLGELPAHLSERLPSGSKVEPRLMAAARLHLTGDRVTDLRLRLLRAHAQQARALARERDALEREISGLLKEARHLLAAALRPGPARLRGTAGGNRRPASLSVRGRIRQLHRDGPDPSLVSRGRWAAGPPSAEPLRQSPAQLGPAHHGRDPPPGRPRDPGVHRPDHDAGQDQSRRPPDRQTPPSAPGVVDDDPRRGGCLLTQRSFRSRSSRTGASGCRPHRPTDQPKGTEPVEKWVRPGGRTPRPNPRS